MLSGQFSDVQIEPGKRSDQAYSANRTNMVQKNELYIRDLGYFRLQDFKSIQDKQGYYLSRLKLPTKIYRKEFEIVEFKTKPAPIEACIYPNSFGRYHETITTWPSIRATRCVCGE